MTKSKIAAVFIIFALISSKHQIVGHGNINLPQEAPMPTPISVPVQNVNNNIHREKTTSRSDINREEIYLGTFEATAYINPRKNKTFCGEDTIPYQTIAVDPKVIPLKSKLKVRRKDTGETYIVRANDTGGVVKGKIIDMVVTDYNTAIRWGRRDVDIWLLKSNEN